MILSAGIYGFSQSGKTTLFNIFTGSHIELISFSKSENNVAVIDVPDKNLDWLNEVYQPDKKVNSKIKIIDFNNNNLSNLYNVDIICIVLRNFTNENVLHHLNRINPQQDFNIIFSDFILDDLKKVENRIEKLTNKKGQKLTNIETIELNLLQKLKEHLEKEKPLYNFPFSQNELSQIRSYSFLTLKPIICILNSDDDFEQKENFKFIKDFFESNNFSYFFIKAKLELEISQLSKEEQAEYMKELGLDDTGRNKLIKEIYKKLNLINFYTVGKDEVRAWAIPKNSTALDAAAAIHSDIAKGFIKAEVVHFNDIKKYGSFEECKKNNIVRLEPKNYIVKDGDCVHIRFNV
ncbi:MAG TPA: DUF933 domain-containing protein [bacterium]|nr:DUF933 domain-containing protein [bacterium]HOL48217.1 DUF933 domain-containing protein [bacterium]HPQ18917.1 DUF933 domain-containing protein [bacterium]